MPKRQRKNTSSSSNPLSQARKGASKAATNGNEIIVDKTIKADDLWHRKSGAGYHLFISYYGSQPCGVVAHGDACKISENTDGLVGSSAKNSESQPNVGMSRAAKKRQKKKAKNPDGNGVYSATNGITDTKQTNDIDERVVLNPSKLPVNQSSHPLIQALASQPKFLHLNSFVQTLATPLPLTFRLRKHESSSFNELEAIISREYSKHISPVSYDPTKSIHQSTPSSNLSKSNLGSIPKLKELIVKNSLNGTLARQEIGSILPVLVLHSVGAIAQGSKVLDLCASPGSKTLQALEIVGQDGGKKGRVIANDVHSTRLDSLRDAVDRSGLPEDLTSRVVFTKYDASVFPPPKSGKLFDAIICDVPCSGDGTIRKDKHILPMWTPNTGNELHGLQLKILSRALELIKVGGVVCYSTCSLNPVEDEAVVAAAMLGLSKSSMKFELMAWPNILLPGFLHRPGIIDWKVAFYDHNNVVHDGDDFGSLTFCVKPADAEEAGISDAVTTLWPPKQLEHLQLDRCVRLFPQDNNTGGFFLVAIKRIK